MSVAGTIAVTALALWLAACAFLWVSQERMIFHPRPLDNDTRIGLAESELSFTAPDGTKLSGWVLEKSDARGALVYFGGNAEEISGELGRYAALLDVTVAGVNYRGYGASEGEPGAAQMRADAVLAFDAILERLDMDAGQAVVLGRSLGSNMATHVASQRDVAGLVLVTPFDSVTKVASSMYPIFPVRLMLRHPFDSLADSATVGAKTLVLKAEVDRVVPHASTDRLLAGWQGSGEVTELTLPGTGHNDISTATGYVEALRSFVTGRLRG